MTQIEKAPINVGKRPSDASGGQGESNPLSPEAKYILRLYEELKSWKQVADRFGLNVGLVWKYAHGQIKKSKVRDAVRKYRAVSRSRKPKYLKRIKDIAVPFLRRRQEVSK